MYLDSVTSLYDRCLFSKSGNLAVASIYKARKYHILKTDNLHILRFGIVPTICQNRLSIFYNCQNFTVHFFLTGALSDVNSAYIDHNHDVDMDDNTSMSSRASSRIFDSDAMMSLDSLSALYDSEYDNCYRTDDDLNAVPDLDRLNYFSVPTDDVHLQNIRSMSESITRNFGQPRSETDPDSDV